MPDNPLTQSIEKHYINKSPHPTDTEEAGWILSHQHTKVALKWIGSGRRVLDLGCHKGDISSAIRDAGNTVTGVDFEALTTMAKEKYNLDVVAHDLNKPLPFKDGEFDTVVAISILDYLPADLAFIRECYRVLEPGGMLVVMAPNAVSLFNRLYTLSGRVGRNFSDQDGYHTLNYYTLKGLSTLLKTAGFNIAEYTKCPKLHSKIPLRYWIEKILPTTLATDLAVKAVK
jgi:ubiquinone/menaquinone biosynthesis C-methylase UbiE